MKIDRQKSQAQKNQSGIVMIFTLIALLLLMLSSVALIRSTDTSMLIAGNLAFKRDLINQGETAISMIKTNFASGVMVDTTKRQTNQTAQGYFATIQASDSNGIPTLLLNTSTFDSTYSSNVITNSTSQITIRYMIDRMCLSTGAPDSSVCSVTSLGAVKGGGSKDSGKSLGATIPVYRISIRITGPRNTETFMQSSFTANG